MPSRVHAKGAAVLVDEFDFSGETNNVDINISNNLGDVSAFADTDATFVEGNPSFTVDVGGLFSLASEDYDGEMFADLTTVDRALGIIPEGRTEGNFGYEAMTNPGPQARTSQYASAVILNVSWQGDKPLIRSQVLTNNSSISSTDTGTAFQHGAVAATEKVFGRVRLLSAPGGAGNNDADITIESDSAEGFSSATTRLTFSTLDQTSTATHEDQEANGAITDDWWRALVTVSGAGSRTFDLLVVVGRLPQDS